MFFVWFFIRYILTCRICIKYIKNFACLVIKEIFLRTKMVDLYWHIFGTFRSHQRKRFVKKSLLEQEMNI